MASLPRAKFYVHTPESVEFFSGPVSKNLKNEGAKTEQNVELNGKINVAEKVQYSKDGKLMGVIAGDGVVRVYDAATMELMKEFPAGAQAIHFSPLNTYLVTIAPRTRKIPDGKNLILWNIGTGEEINRWAEKNTHAEAWPVLQWDDHERYAFKRVSNQVQVFDAEFSKILLRVNQSNLSSFSISPCPQKDDPIHVAVFVPEAPGKPSQVVIYELSDPEFPVISNSGYQASTCTMKWSPNGHCMLAATCGDVSSDTYYGKSSIHLFDVLAEEVKRVGINVHCFNWSPTSQYFVVISGDSPPQATLYNQRGDAKFEFGNAHRNTVSWSPHGRFLCLAGLGNMSGDMDLWDVHKQKRLGCTSAPCSTFARWSPDSRHFLCAVTQRMSVDNGFKIFKYNGDGPVYEQSVEKVIDADWCPSPNVFPSRPETPLKERIEDATVKKAKTTHERKLYRPRHAVTSVPGMPSAQKQAYRPPGGRTLASLTSRNLSGPRKVAQESKSFSGRLPVGAPTPKVSVPKRKKKKTAPKIVEEVKPEPVEEKPKKLTEISVDELSPQEKAKKIKALNKRLKQIDALKAKGGDLNEDQKKKIATEAEIRETLSKLEL